MKELLVHLEPTLLTWLWGLPAFGALAVLFLPRQWSRSIRTFSTGIAFAAFVLSLALLQGDYGTASYQFVATYPLVPSLGIQYKVGVDGISLWLVLLTTLISPLALHASWTHVDTKLKEFAFAFLLLETAMIGAFISLDLFVFYVFWELVLLPMSLIIGVWGGPQRVYASVKFFLYTMLGSLLMLVAILYLVMQYAALTGVYTFDLDALNNLIVERQAQFVLFLAFALAFGIKVPIVPFHTWLPDAHVQAPTGGSVILAAVLLKLGAYGFLRFAVPLFPLAAFTIGPTLAVLAVVAILYGALCAWQQQDLKKLVAYSSVSHLGFVMLGIFSATRQGVSGGLLQMLSHGVSTGALFLLVGVLYERRHTRALEDFGGLAKVMPIYALLLVATAMGSIGLPGTGGFVSELMVLSGAFGSDRLPSAFVFGAVAAFGALFAAIYMLHAVQNVLWGRLDHPENRDLPDVGRRELWTLTPLVALVFVLGVFPGPVLKRMDPSVRHYLGQFQEKLVDTAEREAETRLWRPAQAARERPGSPRVAQLQQEVP